MMMMTIQDYAKKFLFVRHSCYSLHDKVVILMKIMMVMVMIMRIMMLVFLKIQEITQFSAQLLPAVLMAGVFFSCLCTAGVPMFSIF